MLVFAGIDPGSDLDWVPDQSLYWLIICDTFDGDEMYFMFDDYCQFLVAQELLEEYGVYSGFHVVPHTVIAMAPRMRWS